MPPALSIDTAQPRDVKKPLLFECAWEVANKGQPALSLTSALERVGIGDHDALNLFHCLMTTDDIALLTLPCPFLTLPVGCALLRVEPVGFRQLSE